MNYTSKLEKERFREKGYGLGEPYRKFVKRVNKDIKGENASTDMEELLRLLKDLERGYRAAHNQGKVNPGALFDTERHSKWERAIELAEENNLTNLRNAMRELYREDKERDASNHQIANGIARELRWNASEIKEAKGEMAGSSQMGEVLFVNEIQSPIQVDELIENVELQLRNSKFDVDEISYKQVPGGIKIALNLQGAYDYESTLLRVRGRGDSAVVTLPRNSQGESIVKFVQIGE